MADTGATVRLLHITDTHLWPAGEPPPRFVVAIDGHAPAPSSQPAVAVAGPSGGAASPGATACGADSPEGLVKRSFNDCT